MRDLFFMQEIVEIERQAPEGTLNNSIVYVLEHVGSKEAMVKVQIRISPAKSAELLFHHSIRNLSV